MSAAAETMYVMCELSRPCEGGLQRMVSWVRQAIAVPGAVLDKLKNPETGELTSGWRVDHAGNKALPENLLMKKANDWKKTRRFSDI